MHPSRMPALFTSHGAAFFTTSPADATHQFLSGFASVVSGWHPRGIVVVSAHYTGLPLQMTEASALSTIHDHPAQSVYGYRYPGRGDETLQDRVLQALRKGGFDAQVEKGRGLDHGAWVPLSLLHPSGTAPVLQLSLDRRESSGVHVAIGEALAGLRDEGFLILGSGGVTHNQNVFRRGFFSGAEVAMPEAFSREFDSWVSAIVTSENGDSRSRALAKFEEHPSGRLAHPTVEHFLPLLVLAGAAGSDRGQKIFEGFQHSLSTSAFQFG